MSNAAKLIKEQQGLLPKNSPVPNRRILVVDDEPAIGDGIRNILSPASGASPAQAPRSSRTLKVVGVEAASKAPEFDVVVVTNPKDAIAAVEQALRDHAPFALGFFDVMLGADMDGIQLVKKLMEIDSHLFAVFVTAYQDRSVDTIGGVLGEENREKWDYINKPFTEGEILQKARNVSSLWDLHRLKEWQQERLSEANQLLLQHERQTAVAAVGRSVAHEFGNLLTHIIGNAELALEKGGESTFKSAIEVILKASDTAANILKRFRTLHGSMEAATKPALMDVQQTITEALELVEFQFRKRKVQVQRSKADAALVLGQKHSLVQVFVNLFMNAMYVMPSGGTIDISVSQDPEWIQISVHDSGPGIPEDILPRVTEAMFTTKGSEGSGLGLAICKEIVEIEHEGELVVRNHPSGGAEILVRLPQVRPGSKK